MPNTRDSYSEEIMADAATDGVNSFNDKIIAEFRAHGGRLGGSLAATPMILIHHIGARSGIERVTPLAYSPQDDGRIVIVASNGGSPTQPGWCYNLRANPRIEVEVGTETVTVMAEELDGTPAPSCGRS
jgi:deazaflavin-dependent oxidoreductase (nitroreductase family)